MFTTDMKQVTLFLFLYFVTLTLGTREFKKSYIAEFNPRWPTLRAQSAVCIRTILLQKRHNFCIFSCYAACFAMKSRDVTVILLKMGFVVLDHFMALQRNNQPMQIKPVMWIQKVLEAYLY